MIEAITLAQKHGEKHLTVLTDGSVPIEDQRKAFKILQQSRTHPEFARVELWTSSCRTKQRKFDRPTQAKSEPATAPTPPATEETDSPKTDAGGDAAGKQNPKPGQAGRRRP
jgi:hypothetical protein